MADATVMDETLSDSISGIALAPVEQTSICPYPNLSVQNASNGAPFTVYCGSDFLGEIYAPQYSSAEPSYEAILIDTLPSETWQLAWHTGTWQACRDICATSHPVCWRFAFSPTVKWIDCFLKNDSAQVATGWSVVPIFSGALTLTQDDKPSSSHCHAGSHLSVDDVDFTLSCHDFQSPVNDTGGLFGQKRHLNIKDCISGCVSMRNDEAQDCIAIVFDDTLAYGSDNCYFMSDVGTGISQRNYTLAYLTSEAGQYHPPAGQVNDGKHQNLAEMIALPIVGVLVLIALLYAIFRFYQRKTTPRRPRGRFKRLASGADIELENTSVPLPRRTTAIDAHVARPPGSHMWPRWRHDASQDSNANDEP